MLSLESDLTYCTLVSHTLDEFVPLNREILTQKSKYHPQLYNTASKIYTQP
jgi:hypothetical protein